jgi:hypothetical protein
VPPYTRACERGRIPRRPLALLLLTSIACAPIGMSDDEVEVTGVFLPDGRCNARSPRGAVATEPSTGELRYRFDGDFIDGRDVDVHVISCTMPWDSAGEGRLNISLAVPRGSVVPAGRYPVTPRVGVLVASATFWHPAYRVGTKGAGRYDSGGQIYLKSVSGTLELTRIDPPPPTQMLGMSEVKNPRIEGRFAMRARRRWSM